MRQEIYVKKESQGGYTRDKKHKKLNHKESTQETRNIRKKFQGVKHARERNPDEQDT